MDVTAVDAMVKYLKENSPVSVGLDDNMVPI